MDSLISGIIDCVARPSTTDSPIRVIRKTASESPNCVSSDPGMVSFTESTHLMGTHDSDSESSSTGNLLPAPPNVRVAHSSSSLSRLMVPGGGGAHGAGAHGDAASTTPIHSVLTAEGIIMGDDRNYMCGTCGDCATCYDSNGGDDGTISSDHNPDAAVVRQFEAAFATFLYKNPAFTSMSHTNIQKLRGKLLRESARNIQLESELRHQLQDLREAKRNRELELQQELLVVTRAKASREAELLIQIQKTRRSSMELDQKMKAHGVAPPPAPPTPPATSWFGFGFGSSSPASTATPTSPVITGSESFEDFQREIQKNKLEQAHILAEMEKIKMQIAEDNLNATP